MPGSLLLLLFIACPPLFAQPKHLPVNIKTLTVEDGLSQSTVYSIAQDSKGFMWFATFNGLDRYDGNEFVHFRHTESDPFSISSNQVYSLLTDSKGRLWAGTWADGLNYFDAPARRWYHFLPGKNIRDIQEAPDGGLYVCDYEKLMHLSIVPVSGGKKEDMPFRIDTTVTKLPLAVAMPSAGNARLFADRDNQVYLTTRTDLYSVGYDKASRSIRFIKLFTYRRGWETPAFLQDPNTKKYYLSMIDGVWESGNNRFSQPTKIHAAIPYFHSVYIDKQSRLWYNSGERTDTLNLLTGKDALFSRLTNATGNIFAQLIPVIQDRNGTLWMKTPISGIATYADDENYFHTLLSGSFINPISAVNDSDCLINEQFILNFGKNGITQTERQQKEADFFHNTFSTRCGNGEAWYVEDTMLVHYNPATGTRRARPIPYRRFGVPLEHNQGSGATANMVLYSISVLPSIIDRDSCLWLYYAHGFGYYDIPKDSFHYINQGADNRNFYQDAAGLIWMNGNDGIYAYYKSSGAIHFFARGKAANADGPPATKSETVFCDDPLDAQHIIWIGTRNWLYRMDKQTGKCRCFTNFAGLPDNLIYSLLRDEKQGNLWMSTNQGLSCLNAAMFGIRNFSEADGLPGREFNTRAALQMKDGTMLFGGTQGLTYFHPEQIVSITPPLTVLTGCQLFGKPVEKNATGASLADLAYTNNVSISYRDNMVTFAFAGTDYRKKNGLQYRYKMNGFDKDWNYAGSNHEATYTNLDPGNYSFVAEASNTNGVWGKNSEPLAVHIIPLWWQTWWFDVLIATAAFALIYLVYRYRLRKALEVERVRNRIASDLHDEIGSTLSAITLFSQIAHEQSKTTVTSPEQLLKRINETSQKVTQTMSDIVWSISTKNDSFDKMITHMHEHAAELLDLKGYELHFSADEKLNHVSLSMEKRQAIYLIYKEALTNIVKHTDGKNVWICIRKEKNHLLLSLKDDGAGFAAHTPNGAGKVNGSNGANGGNGLQNMKNRAYSVGGSVRITSAADSGCEVVVSVPV